LFRFPFRKIEVILSIIQFLGLRGLPAKTHTAFENGTFSPSSGQSVSCSTIVHSAILFMVFVVLHL
jgi:hypothetical protein